MYGKQLFLIALGMEIINHLVYGAISQSGSVSSLVDFKFASYDEYKEYNFAAGITLKTRKRGEFTLRVKNLDQDLKGQCNEVRLIFNRSVAHCLYPAVVCVTDYKTIRLDTRATQVFEIILKRITSLEVMMTSLLVTSVVKVESTTNVSYYQVDNCKNRYDAGKGVNWGKTVCYFKQFKQQVHTFAVATITTIKCKNCDLHPKEKKATNRKLNGWRIMLRLSHYFTVSLVIIIIFGSQ